MYMEKNNMKSKIISFSLELIDLIMNKISVQSTKIGGVWFVYVWYDDQPERLGEAGQALCQFWSDQPGSQSGGLPCSLVQTYTNNKEMETIRKLFLPFKLC